MVPFLSIQPLVENAVRHGLESKEGGGRITITAQDSGAFAEISVEDDGVGIDPERARAVLAGGAPGEHVGLRNVDARLRQVYGEEHGLVVETNVGRGHAGAHARAEVPARPRRGIRRRRPRPRWKTGTMTINVLIADDEQPAIDELAFLLGQDPRIGVIHQAASGAEAIRLLTREPVDAAFLDIHMPGLTGFDLARAMARFERRPALVFVTADEEGALEAFDLAAVDYLLKPVRAERLHRSVSRIVEALKAGAAAQAGAAASEPQPEMIAVTLGGTTRMIRRDEVRYVQAQGDYARLHTEEASYLVRVPMSDLERQWADAFVRIHRSYLVAIGHLTRIRLGGDHPSVAVGGAELPVSRRLLPALRERLEAATIRPRHERRAAARRSRRPEGRIETSGRTMVSIRRLRRLLDRRMRRRGCG